MSDTYILKIACRNCGHVWDQEIPCGMTWQNALNQSDWEQLRVPAGFGSHCKGSHQEYGDETSAGNFCKGCCFTEVYCPNCASPNVGKAPVAEAPVKMRREWKLVGIGMPLSNASILPELEGWDVFHLEPHPGSPVSAATILAYRDAPVETEEERV